MVAPELEKVAAADAGRVLIIKVNTDELPTLAQRGRIQSIPTMAIFFRGREIGAYRRRRSAAAIQSFSPPGARGKPTVARTGVCLLFSRVVFPGTFVT